VSCVLACLRVCLGYLLIELTFSGSPLFERVKKVSGCSQSGCNFLSLFDTKPPPHSPRTLRHSHGSVALQICQPSTLLLSNGQRLLQPVDLGPPHKRPVVAMAILYPTPPGQVFRTVLTPQAPSHPSPHPFTKNVLGHLLLKQLCSVFQRLFSCDIDRRRTRGRKKGENTNLKKRRESAVCSL